MGRDNQPKERQRKGLERKREHGRAPCDRILIVSEGRKTEPQYFDEIRRWFRLPVRNVTALASELGTNPVQVVQYAKTLFEHGDLKKNIEPRSFERVFAVFDRDEHGGYFDALCQAKALDLKLKNDEKRRIHFKAISSVPCFELWLLLHYEDIRVPIERDEAIRRLKQHIPGYTKGMNNVFATTHCYLETAIRRAEALTNHFNACTGPFTHVAELVRLLTELRS